LSLHHHSQLLQFLLVKVKVDLDNCVNFVVISKKIETLGEKLREITMKDESQRVRARREELYWRKRQLMSEELSKWQQIQPRKIASDTRNEIIQVASLPSFFNRIRRLDPSRDRLTSSLFLNVPLRSSQGRNALQDMITLCKDNLRVVYRSSLRPENRHCSISQCARQMNRFVYLFSLIFKIFG